MPTTDSSPLTPARLRGDGAPAWWGEGEYEQLERAFAPVYELVLAASRPRPGERLLDVCCGLGELAAGAARAGAAVTAVDFSPAMLARAARRPEPVAWRRADCQRLPFAEASFDVVVSTFGVVFAPDPEQAAAELARVCRDRIVLTAWQPAPPEQNPWTRFFAPTTSPWASPDELERLLPGFRLAHEQRTLSFEGASGAGLWDWLVRASPPIRERLRQLPPTQAEAAASAWIDHLETQRDGDHVRHTDTYLLTHGRRIGGR